MTREERAAQVKVYYERHKAKLLARNWEKQIRKCGWTPNEYWRAFNEQGGKCFICGTKQKKRLAADHCHKTGHRRALLCSSCNTMLGLAKDNPQILIQAIEYLEKSGALYGSDVQMEVGEIA